MWTSAQHRFTTALPMEYALIMTDHFNANVNQDLQEMVKLVVVSNRMVEVCRPFSPISNCVVTNVFVYPCFSSLFHYIDIDECTLQTHDCSPTAECTNGEGSFQCECKQGFTGDGETCNGTFKI